jgi:hypothetical protein
MEMGTFHEVVRYSVFQKKMDPKRTATLIHPQHIPYY